jgi:hypothetical protein
MKPILIIIAILMSGMIGSAQTFGRFEMNISDENPGIDVLAGIDLHQFTIPPETAIRLTMPSTGKKSLVVVPFQIDKDNKTATFVLANEYRKSTRKLTFEIVSYKESDNPKMKIVDKDGALTIHYRKKTLLRYYYKTVYPPHGIDTNYKRSGFIHPLWTPNGQELTRIQPPDHYHHYGIWNPWTHTLFENDTIDFWNIKGKSGTVRFAKFSSITSGKVYSEFETLHEHVVFKKDGSEKIALNEWQTLRVYKPQKKSGYYIVDITSKMSCASASPLLLLTYRYGGLGWRATEEWTKDNCEVLTSEGKTRKNTDGSKARWCIVQGTLGKDFGGVVMLSHPNNYNHPEPLRIWDEKANGGRGDMFANFAPTKDKDWLLEPGKIYVLKYRLIVFNGKFDATKAETAWQYFAKPVEIKVLSN